MDVTFGRRRCFALLAAAAGFACSQQAEQAVGVSGAAEGAEPLSVYSVSYPLQYFAERIGGDLVRARFPAPPDVDPASWSPDPETVAAYQGAELILLNGAGYAGWVQRASLPRTRQVDTAAEFRDRFVPLEHSVTHSHGPQGSHSHAGAAFTTWLDPALAAEQARAVMEALAKARPEHEAEFRGGYEALAAELRDLDARLAAAAKGVAGAPLLFSHPVYQYFSRRYGLNARSLHWEPHEVPSQLQWRELAELLAAHPARWMIWEGDPAPETAERLRALGVDSLVYAPCGNRPEKGDFLAAMRRNAAAFEALAVSQAGGSRVQNEESIGEE
jgi:zinc transport system substrate-binding protein